MAAEPMRKRYSAWFRIYSDEISPDEMTRLLGMEPSLTQRKGEERGRGLRWSQNMWNYDAEEGQDDLENQIRSLTETFRAKKDVLASLHDKVSVIFWCACFSSDPETSVTLSPQTLSAMGSLGGELMLSVYAVEDEAGNEAE